MSQVMKFTSRILPIEVGQSIVVYGKAGLNPHNFEVDLSDSENLCLGSVDIHLHLSFIFGETGVVERNSHTKGVGWESKEVEQNMIKGSAANPIKPGEDFKIAIYVDAADFFVTINEKPFCVFPQRKPLHEIQWLGVWRDVEKIYRVDHVTASPKCWPLANPNVYTGSIPKQLKAGNVIIVAATPKGRGDFVFNLVQTENCRKLFHFRPQLSASTILMNDQSDEIQWRDEVNSKHSPFPFETNRKFKLAIALTDKNILIAVDGKRIAAFEYRDVGSSIFKWIGGVEIISNDEMQLQITAVNFMLLAPDCKDFETFSK